MDSRGTCYEAHAMKGMPAACFPCAACSLERGSHPRRESIDTRKVSIPTRSLQINIHGSERERENRNHSPRPEPPSFQQNPPLRFVKRLLPWRRTARNGGAWRHRTAREHLVVVCLSPREEVTAARYSTGPGW